MQINYEFMVDILGVGRIKGIWLEAILGALNVNGLHCMFDNSRFLSAFDTMNNFDLEIHRTYVMVEVGFYVCHIVDGIRKIYNLDPLRSFECISRS